MSCQALAVDADYRVSNANDAMVAFTVDDHVVISC
jgi:hypothetical protein